METSQKASYISFKERLPDISENGHPEKAIYISRKGTFLYFRKCKS